MSLAQSAAVGAKWSVVSVAGRHLVTVVTSVILARLLAPADFGLVAMAAVFVRCVELVRDMGTGAGIVQADRPSDRLLSSVFWLNLGLGAVASGLLFLVAPWAAVLFREPRLSVILRVLSVSPFAAALSVVHTSLLVRELRFRRLAVAELAGVLFGGVAGVILALRGYAVWSLVWQSICGVLLASVGIWLATPWRPRLTFEASSLQSIVRFSANLTGFNILNFFIRYADNLLIGRYLGAWNLGLYDLAYRIMLSPLQYVSSAFGRSLFPVYTRMRTDHRRLSSAYLKVASAIGLISFPILFGVAGIAAPFVDATFGPAWAPVAPLLLILGPLGALQAISTTVALVYQAVGRTDLLLRWGAGAGALLVASFVVGLQWGIVGVATCYAIVSYALAYPLFKIPLSLIGLPVSDLVGAVSRPLSCSLVMLSVVLLLGRVLPNTFSASSLLVILVPVAVLIYGDRKSVV